MRTYSATVSVHPYSSDILGDDFRDVRAAEFGDLDRRSGAKKLNRRRVRVESQKPEAAK
jgi:hypothetical protein